MNWHVYDDSTGQWGEVVIKQNLKEHDDKIASADEYGHVKIDEDTLVLDVDGKLKVADRISNPHDPVVYFNVGTNITMGRINEAHFYVPFNCKIKSLNVSLVQFSANEMKMNLEKTKDFATWTNVFQNPLTVSPNTHSQEFLIQGDVTLNKGELVFVNVAETNNDAKNMVITMIIEKI